MARHCPSCTCPNCVEGKLVKIGTVEKLINESQIKNAIQFKVDNDISFLKETLEKQLAVDVDVIDSNTVRIYFV